MVYGCDPPPSSPSCNTIEMKSTVVQEASDDIAEIQGRRKHGQAGGKLGLCVEIWETSVHGRIINK